jgi:transcriptional regulator with XRE-family HTH domain
MNDEERRKELADFLRTRRARLQPADVGLPPGLRRKTAGLRREEIAQLANVSVTWYTWLEQGRAIQVSEQVLESLAHALLLHADEKAHLFFLARQTLPPDSVSRQETVSPLLQRFLDQLEPNPAYLTGRRWDLLAWNRAACVVLGEVDAFAPDQRNILRLVFTDQEFRQRVVDWEVVAQRVLAQFRLSSGCATGDPWFRVLIEDLKRTSQEFRAWWPRHEIKGRQSGRKELVRSDVGHLVLEHTTFQVSENPVLKVVVYLASSEANTLEKLRQLMRCKEATVEEIFT